ncbi:MAG: amino acid-binding protein, partial [Alphaproteobacteria bacterium]|nr:amino acid-binding protein [Alphaproteobacteria bacterium]
MKTILVSILCADRTGLVSAVAGRLFELGANLGDTTFAVLGEGAELTSLVEIPDEVKPETVEQELRALEEIGDGKVTVSHFDLPAVHGPSGKLTHYIRVTGGDSPGLNPRLSELFVQYGANIVGLHAEKVPQTDGTQYSIRFAVWIPEDRADACI